MGYAPFQLLELSVISAQDLAPVSKKLRTYAITWVTPERKLRTKIDQHGQINPTWNDKFVFRVDEKFLNSETSAVMIEIYALGWLKDVKVGSIRVLLSNLLPPSVRVEGASTRRFVALQIRRRSGRPQGILNMGVALLDNTMRTMPLYTELSASAVGFHDMMDVKIYKQHANRRASEQKLGGATGENEATKIQLRRTNSDRTDLATEEKVNKGVGGGGSVCNGGSIVNGTGYIGSSVNGDSIVNGSEVCASDIGPSPSVVAAAVARGLILTPLGVPRDPGSSILGNWKTEESDVEGLKSKIDRWRSEFPPLHSFQNNNNSTVNHPKSKKSSSIHKRSHTDEGNSGLFTCVGKVFGCEFTIVCGGKANRKHNSRSKNKVYDSELLGSSILSQT